MVRMKDEIALTFYKRVDVGVHDIFLVRTVHGTLPSNGHGVHLVILL